MTPRRLTAREIQVADLVARGYKNRQIMATAFLTARRVEVIIATIADKLDLDRDRNIRVQIALHFTTRKTA